MNNILSFEDYIREFRLLEQQRFNQVEEHVNEGLITKWRKFKSTVFVDKVLKDEIELGKAFEERIKETMKELADACEELETKSKRGSEFTKKVEKIIKDINNISFDALTLIGDQDIDFGGFRRSVIMANVVKLGALLSPVKNALMIRKAYRYFIGLIKQVVRKDLVMLIINFDQFQNMILQKSLESAESARTAQEIAHITGEIENEYKNMFKNLVKNDVKKLKEMEITLEKTSKNRRDLVKNDPVMTLMMNSYDNTYKQTAETIKSFLNDDSQKQLEALKNGISKLSQGDDDLSVYGELLISNAEEKALKTAHVIHNNFLKMSEVFKLSNQKNLIELISEAEKEEQKRVSKENKEIKEKFKADVKEEEIKFVKEKFEKIVSGLDKPLKDITSEDLDKLGEETVKFKYEDDKNETEKKFTKLEILLGYLSFGDKESQNELKKCSYDLKMRVTPVDKKQNEFSYLNYIDVLAYNVDKALVKENNNDDECYLDLFRINSVSDIESVLTYFDGDNDENNQKKVLEYIDKIVHIPSIDTLLEKIHDAIGDKDVEIKDIKKYLTSKESPEYKKYVKLNKYYTDWKKYNDEYEKLKKKGKSGAADAKDKRDDVENSFKNDDDFKGKTFPTKAPKNPNKKPYQFRISISYDDFKRWGESFKKMREYLENGNDNEDK